MNTEEVDNSAKRNPFKKGGMFQGANPLIFQLSKDLRKNMTHAEQILWMHLKKGVKGLKFRRQHTLGNYVADFYCHKIKLVVEVDGLIHQDESIKIYDASRERDLKDLGCEILRFTNEEVEQTPETVFKKIEEKIEQLLKNIADNQNQKASL
jgi:very-short-patch-repair endonuclease